MVNVSGNFYGTLLLLLMAVTFIGLYTTEPSVTGFVVKEQSDFSEFAIELYDNEQHLCADGSYYQECSSLLKGKFCHLGKLTDYCELCGCDAGEVCLDRKCVKVD